MFRGFGWGSVFLEVGLTSGLLWAVVRFDFVVGLVGCVGWLVCIVWLCLLCGCLASGLLLMWICCVDDLCCRISSCLRLVCL